MGSSHIHIISDKKVIIKNIRNIPAKNRLHLLRRIVAVRKVQNVLDGFRDKRLRPFRNLCLGSTGFLRRLIIRCRLTVRRLALCLTSVRRHRLPVFIQSRHRLLSGQSIRLRLQLISRRFLQIGQIIDQSAGFVIERISDQMILIRDRRQRRLRKIFRGDIVRLTDFTRQSRQPCLFQAVVSDDINVRNHAGIQRRLIDAFQILQSGHQPWNHTHFASLRKIQRCGCKKIG